MSATGKQSGLLSGLRNPAAKGVAPVVIPPEAEHILGLAPPDTGTRREEAGESLASTAEPERSKTFFLPYSLCERLEMQKLSERRDMKYIVRNALEKYFEEHPLRQGVREAFKV